MFKKSLALGALAGSFLLAAFLSDPNSGGIKGSITSRGKTLSFLQAVPSASPSPTGTFLPNAGPFASSGSVNVNTLTNFTLSDTETFPVNSQASPIKYNSLTLSPSTGQWNASSDTTYQINIWCNTLTLGNGSTIDASGMSAQTPADNTTGGDGADGANGGDPGGSDNGPGAPGQSVWGVSPTFAFGNGGASTGSNVADVGRGGGGAGSNYGSIPDNSGGGGGGGAGLINVVCNTINGAANNHVRANGGALALDFNGDLFNQTGGGGGVVYFAAVHYNGLIPTANVTALGSNASNGTTKIFQINSDNTTTQRAFNLSW